MILAAIIACEIGFWVAILAGLCARYLLHRPRLGAVLLALVPVIDLLLLALVTVDLLGGATASWHHGLAAVYIGLSVAYGRRMVQWADLRFRHRFASGPPPVRLTGWEHTRACWGNVLRTLLAVGIAAGLLAAMIAIVGDAGRTAALAGYFSILAVILAIDVLYAASYTIWPKRPGLAPSTLAERGA
ncbi:hypothetical protein [Micrococcus terreus]|uniref:Uncharacterized protein n=1 Tax=Micrococcus terreus TaxID=574650 RepID=A0A1I7MQ33_9MICC|nr:hypothetical protein [Micrococcus terreus]SFV24042.1 hypothetical protein SAMN04487966_10978 [Micrococcus terreus]